MKANRKVACFVLFSALLITYSTFRTSTAAPAPHLLQLYVDKNSGADREDGSTQSPFKSISKALLAAADNADIYIGRGDYYENLKISSEVNLHGSPDQGTRLIGSLSEQSLVRFEASGSIDHFVLVPDLSSASPDDAVPIGVAIRNPAQNVQVKNCTIQHCSVGIEAAGSSANVLIENNSLSNNQFGIGAVHNQGKVTLSGNSIESNFTGIFSSETNVEATANTITENKHGFHIGTRDNDPRAYRVSLEGNTIANNHKTGIWFDQGTQQMQTTVDLGGSGSLGGNVIGENGTYDIFNQTKGGEIFAQNNNFTTRRFANSGTTSHVRTTSLSSTSPRIHLSLNPNVIEQPNGEMVRIHATISADDSGNARPLVVLTSIASSDPESDSANVDDIPSDIADADFRSEDTDFEVRAEVAGLSDRVYTVTYVATDSNGNSTPATATITVKNPRSVDGGAK